MSAGGAVMDEQSSTEDRGIRCPKCLSGWCPEVKKPFKTAEVYPLGPRRSIRRVRKCHHCGHRFSTYERVVENNTGIGDSANRS